MALYALVSKNTLKSSGEIKEIGFAKDEGKKIIGLWVYKDDRTKPAALSGKRIIPWTWEGITKFINSL